jgi:E3 ubiquitin-protein ligase RNF213
LSTAYLNLCEHAKAKREFFGLRDFYCLIKMIYWHIRDDQSCLDMSFLNRAIRRNFGGLVDIDPVKIFKDQFTKDKIYLENHLNNKSCQSNVIDMIKEALIKKTTEDENRYLLLISQNENGLDLINNYILNEFDKDKNQIKIIFGSSFPNDQHYSQICRKIHQIKLSMEHGKTVILMNLENLYESLYDALNQFYYKFGDNEKFVDLGLGTQRVKCLVHNDFRLIVIANKDSVYNPKKYPIPLVNRLEKHLLSIESILDDNMKLIVDELDNWCSYITKISEKYSGNHFGKTGSLKPSDIFIGFTEDSIPTLVFKLYNETKNNELCISKAKEYLIQCASSDGIIRLIQNDHSEKENLTEIVELYFKNQVHDNFCDFFNKILIEKENKDNTCGFTQITTNSKLLSANDLKTLSSYNKIISVISLLAIDTQQQLITELKEFFSFKSESKELINKILIIQCDCGHFYQELINCARYTINDEYSKYLMDKNESNQMDPYDESSLNQPKEESNVKFNVILIIQSPKISGGCIAGFQTTKWFCYHIDDLQDNLSIGNLLNYKDKSLGDFFSQAVISSNVENITLMKILQSVIYTSCSKINDYAKHSDRSIKRVEILIKLLKSEHNKFCSILIKHLSNLQIDREQTVTNYQLAKNWIFKTGYLSNVIKFGTLKNSCINHIENRLSHLFSGLVAFIDTNNNLDLLVDSKKEWLADYWLNIFNNEQIIGIQYENYYLHSNNKEKMEFICLNNCNTLNDMKLKLPFSWLIKKFLDELVHLKIKEFKNQSTPKFMLDQLKSAFNESFVHKILEDCVSENMSEFIDLYLNDFIVLSFKESFKSKEYFELVKKRIKDYCSHHFLSSFRDLSSLVCFNLAFENLKQELYLFTKFIQTDDAIISNLAKSQNENINLCFLAAKYVCFTFNAASAKMKQKDWEEWFKKAKKFMLLIENFIDLFPAEDEYKEDYSEFKSIWHKVTILKLFIENVCHLDQNLYIKCIQLWNYLDRAGEDQKIKVDLKKEESFRKLVDFLEKMSKSLKKKCKGCDEKDCSTLFSIGCKPECMICLKCKDSLKTTKKCPVCSTEMKSISEISETPNNYNKTKLGINCFFMEIVTKLCLDGTKILPDSSVINSIIEYLLPKSKNENSSSTIDFNLSPSIKSTLFQLLLNYNKDDVETHLNAIFSKSAKYLTENFEKDDIIDLKLIYINAIEDSFYCKQIANENLNIELGIEFLNNLNDIDSNNQMEQFKIIAKIKFIITTLANLMIKHDNENELELIFIKMAKNFFQNETLSIWPRFFMIKYVFRRYGKNVLINHKNNDLFNWILPETSQNNVIFQIIKEF